MEETIFSMDKQKDKRQRQNGKKFQKNHKYQNFNIRKARKYFDSFTMEYNPEFVKFFNDNIEEIIPNSEYKDIATIQRLFKRYCKNKCR